ncbi:MAG: PIN domain-containing protein [Marinoscillum sp.]
MILTDSSVWSQILRRKSNYHTHIISELSSLIRQNEVAIIGAIRQEVLTGIKHQSQFEKVKIGLAAFPDIPILTDDHVYAAEMSNRCRLKGIQGSPIDFLICAVANRFDMQIFTLDKDFLHYQKHLPIKLYPI